MQARARGELVEQLGAVPEVLAVRRRHCYDFLENGDARVRSDWSELRLLEHVVVGRVRELDEVQAVLDALDDALPVRVVLLWDVDFDFVTRTNVTATAPSQSLNKKAPLRLWRLANHGCISFRRFFTLPIHSSETYKVRIVLNVGELPRSVGFILCIKNFDSQASHETLT